MILPRLESKFFKIKQEFLLIGAIIEVLWMIYLDAIFHVIIEIFLVDE